MPTDTATQPHHLDHHLARAHADTLIYTTPARHRRIIRAFLVEEAKIVKQVMKAASAKK